MEQFFFNMYFTTLQALEFEEESCVHRLNQHFCPLCMSLQVMFEIDPGSKLFIVISMISDQ